MTDNKQGQRQNCPHAPHEATCGPTHKGPCALEHPGGSCGAVQLICPNCHDVRRRVHIPGIVTRVKTDFVVDLQCTACDRMTMIIDQEMICLVCDWLVPDVNERLAKLWASAGPRH